MELLLESIPDENPEITSVNRLCGVFIFLFEHCVIRENAVNNKNTLVSGLNNFIVSISYLLTLK
tara:strand:+ start:226 stop:417 length:192 start_codon:yes stop_codon:yes gene_type:complete